MRLASSGPVLSYSVLGAVADGPGVPQVIADGATDVVTGFQFQFQLDAVLGIQLPRLVWTVEANFQSSVQGASTLLSARITHSSGTPQGVRSLPALVANTDAFIQTRVQFQNGPLRSGQITVDAQVTAAGGISTISDVQGLLQIYDATAAPVV